MKPSKCCNIVYTSGTTGNPKGVMLSHDNMLFNSSMSVDSMINEIGWQLDGSERIVSYLPMSHSAAQCCDLLLSIQGNATIYFAQPDALQGSLIDTLKEAKPTLFFSVPRVWEKFEEKLKEFGANKHWMLMAMSTWAKDKGLRKNLAIQTTLAPGTVKTTVPWTFPIAKFLVLN